MEQEVTDKDLIGTFEHTSSYGSWKGIKNVIEFHDDYTFLHTIYKNDSMIVEEVGRWKLYPKGQFVKTNRIEIQNFTIYIQHYSEEMIFSEGNYRGMTAKNNLFEKVYLEVNIPHDPDGSPMKPKYKKIK